MTHQDNKYYKISKYSNMFRLILLRIIRLYIKENITVILTTAIYISTSQTLQCIILIYTVGQLYNETDFILTKIEMPSMKQCMPSKCPNFICNPATPQRPTLSMTGNTAPCCVGRERTWSQ
jgi:hypothetical protein